MPAFFQYLISKPNNLLRMLPMALSMFIDFYLVPLTKVWHFSKGKLHITCYLYFVNLFKIHGINLFLIVRIVPRYEQKTVKITVGKCSVSKAFFHQFAIVVHYLLTYLNINLLTYLLSYIFTYLLTAWGRVLLDKHPVCS